MMKRSHKSLSKDELLQKLVEAEEIIEALRNNEVDAIVGNKEVSLVRLREVEVRLIEARDLAEERAQELEDFSYSISHDLRNPLNIIKLSTEMLMEDHSDQLDESGKDFVDKINKNTDRMIDHISHILTLSRVGRQELQKSEVDLKKLAEEITANISAAHPDRKHDIIIQDNMIVMADGELLKTALQNLLSNAWKFSSKKPETTIEIGYQDQNEARIYYIRDNGIGFDMDNSEELFSRFKRLHDENKYPGTGVGLPITKRIIEKHGGQIWAESEPGKGATFYFTIP